MFTLNYLAPANTIVSEDLNTSTEVTILHDFTGILKRMLQNYRKIVKKCFLIINVDHEQMIEWNWSSKHKGLNICMLTVCYWCCIQIRMFTEMLNLMCRTNYFTKTLKYLIWSVLFIRHCCFVVQNNAWRRIHLCINSDSCLLVVFHKRLDN